PVLRLDGIVHGDGGRLPRRGRRVALRRSLPPAGLARHRGEALMLRGLLLWLALVLCMPQARALERPGVTFKVFQFPPDRIPRIDGDDSDWAIVPDSYAIGLDQLVDTEAPGGHGTHRDP